MNTDTMPTGAPDRRFTGSEAQRAVDRRIPVEWPIRATHPAKHVQVPAERRAGPRSQSYWADLA